MRSSATLTIDPTGGKSNQLRDVIDKKRQSTYGLWCLWDIFKAFQQLVHRSWSPQWSTERSPKETSAALTGGNHLMVIKVWCCKIESSEWWFDVILSPVHLNPGNVSDINFLIWTRWTCFCTFFCLFTIKINRSTYKSLKELSQILKMSSLMKNKPTITWVEF